MFLTTRSTNKSFSVKSNFLKHSKVVSVLNCKPKPKRKHYTMLIFSKFAPPASKIHKRQTFFLLFLFKKCSGFFIITFKYILKDIQQINFVNISDFGHDYSWDDYPL